MNGAERLLELAKGAMLASAQVHADIERLRYEAWLADDTKGKKRWEPMIDRASIVATFEDLFHASVEALRKEARHGD